MVGILHSKETDQSCFKKNFSEDDFALAALQAHNRPGYNTVIVRIGSDAALPGEQDPLALAPARFVFSHTSKSRTSNLGEKCTNLVSLLS